MAVAIRPAQDTKCPVCGSDQCSLEYSISSHDAAQSFVVRQGDAQRHDALVHHIEEVWGLGACEIVTCKDCNFCFASPYVAGDSTYYNLAFPRAGYLAERWEFDRTLDDLRSTEFVGQRVLEVGAGLGNFLDKIIDRHVPRDGITAIEYSDQALRTLREKGYYAISDDIRRADIPPGLDAIFLFQVVEHMDNLTSLFEKLVELVRPLGAIYIAVPNYAAVRFNQKNGSGILIMPPHHIGCWSRAAFDRIAAANGLRIAALELEPFSLLKFIMWDIGDDYLLKSRKAGTLANWSRARRASKGGKAIGAAVAMAGAFRRVPVWINAMRRGSLGSSLWIKLIRIAE